MAIEGWFDGVTLDGEEFRILLDSGLDDVLVYSGGRLGGVTACGDTFVSV